VSVRDSGIGISPDHHHVIFEDFRQVDDSLARPYMGTGLGLAICRRLASALGGRIKLRSRLGEGATFTLSLPLELKA
jgi:signal transduction histidine kinase